MQTQTHSLPPHCPEAERGVLGCCLIDITIRITTRGGHHEQRVRVVIRDLLGIAIEDGSATWAETTATWCYLTTANVLFDEILLVTAMVVSPHHQSDRQVTCIPLDLHFTTVFKTAPWAKAAGLGRWKDN